MTRDTFGELRSVLQRMPDEASWGELCASLDQLPAPRLEAEVIPYAQRLLESWPDVFRAAPWRWLEGAFRRVYHPGLALVRTLDVRGRKLRLDQLEALASAPFMPSVRHIYLQNNKAGPGAVRALLTPDATRDLEVLNLDGNSLGDDGASVLAGLEVSERVEEVSLERNFLSDEGVRALVEGSGWSRLKSLELGANLLGRALPEFQAWSASEVVGRLEHLSLSGSLAMRMRHAEALAATGLGAMRVLEVQGVEMGGEALSALLARGVAPALEGLVLDWNKVGATGARWLASRPESRALRTLDLRRNMIGEEGALALADSEYLGGLTMLWLEYNALGERGRRALSRAPWFGGLEYVALKAP